jgi:uncharacterized membrane protein YdjX (TVP38/TMEM64 family)
MEIKETITSLKRYLFLWWAVIFCVYVALYLIRRNNDGPSFDEIKNIIESYGILGPTVFILIYPFRIALFLPMSFLTAVSGALWGYYGLIYVLIGISLGATTEFFIARYVARSRVEKVFKKNMEYLEAKIAGRAFMAVFLLRLFPNVQFEIQNIGLALTRIRYKDFIAGTVLGMLPGILVFILLGRSLFELFF